MSATTAIVPVTIAPEAAGHVHGLGLDRELEQIVDHLLQTVPELQRIEATVSFDRDSPVPEAVLLQACVPEPEGTPDLTWLQEFDRWMLTTFPVAIAMHFTVTARYEACHGR